MRRREGRGQAIGLAARIVAALVWGTGQLAAETLPVLDPPEATARPECRAALQMAERAFRATSPDLTWPIFPPDADLATIVLSRKSHDLSGGDVLQADPEIFARSAPFAGVNHYLYWQIAPRDGRRMAVIDSEFNWRGSWFTLYLLDEGQTREAFLQARYPKADPAPPAPLPLLGDNRWKPPMVLRDTAAGGLWVIDPGERYMKALPDWQVFAMDEGAFRPLCRVIFWPTVGDGLDLLPRDLRGFGALADEALGPGTGEGTLRPTDEIRSRVALDWANLAVRPWALTGKAQSRAEVDAGLELWAQGVPARRRLLRDLRRSEPAAQAALAEYLSARFALTPDQAEAFSRYAVDLMLRRHFVFHRDRSVPKPPDPPSPWPETLR